MKTLPSGLQAHLDSGATSLCWCWKIARGDGAVQGFTDHDNPLVFDGVTYAPASGFTASEVQSTLGLSVDNLTVVGALIMKAMIGPQANPTTGAVNSLASESAKKIAKDERP